MPIPLIIDTDPGVDDAVALVLALHSPEVALRAVTTTFGNVELATTHRNAGRVLALAGRSDVPVAAGAARPLVHARMPRVGQPHGADGLSGLGAQFPEPAGAWVDLPSGPAPELGHLGPGSGSPPDSAPALAAAVLRAGGEPVTIVSIGPLTNTALLLAAHPDLIGRIGRIVVSGGALGTAAPFEFNVRADPEAARRVLTRTDVPITLVPLDLTMRCLADGRWLAALAAAGPRCRLLARVLDAHRHRFRARHGIDAVAVHDAVAVLEAAVPGTLSTRSTPVRVDCDPGPTRGRLLPDRRNGTPLWIAETADVTAVLARVLDRVRELG